MHTNRTSTKETENISETTNLQLSSCQINMSAVPRAVDNVGNVGNVGNIARNYEKG
jgi:hypothetical protein